MLCKGTAHTQLKAEALVIAINFNALMHVTLRSFINKTRHGKKSHERYQPDTQCQGVFHNHERLSLGTASYQKNK